MGGQMAYPDGYETQKKEWRATWIENSDRVRFHRKGINPAGGGQDPDACGPDYLLWRSCAGVSFFSKGSVGRPPVLHQGKP